MSNSPFISEANQKSHENESGEKLFSVKTQNREYISCIWLFKLGLKKILIRPFNCFSLKNPNLLKECL